MSDSKNVSAALVAAQSKIRNVPFDSTNPHFGSKFVSLAAVLDAVRPILSAHGLALFQPASTANGMVQVSTVFMHESGEQIAFPPLALPITDKTTAQALGSMVTYLRRYSLTAAVGIAGDEDTDGNDVSQPAPARAPARPVAASSAPAASKPAPAAKPAAAAPDASGGDVVGTVVYLKSEPGEKNGRPYVKHRIGIQRANGEPVYYTSFSETVGELAAQVNKTDAQVRAVLGGAKGDLIQTLEVVEGAHVADIPF